MDAGGDAAGVRDGECGGTECAIATTCYRYDLSRGWNSGDGYGAGELACVFDASWADGAEWKHFGDDCERAAC